MKIEDKLSRYRKKGIGIWAATELIAIITLAVFYIITLDACMLFGGFLASSLVIILIIYVEFLGRKDFILTLNMIQLPGKPGARFMTGPLDRSQIKIDDITGCRVYNNLILVWIDIIGYPIRKEQLDDFDHVRDALIKLLKSRNVPIEIFNRDIVEPPTV
jgi:hypothetical protein